MINKNLKIYLSILLLLTEVMFLFFLTFYQSLQNDENEHLYNAYMIFKGFSPYIDFFEHHNPLMWYLVAPLYIFFENNIIIYYILRFIMFISIILTGVFVYKISCKLKLPTFYCLLAICFYFGFDYVKQTGIQIRPDTPMALCSTIAFFFFLTYLDTKRNFHLFLSLSFFGASFWFLQKSIASIFPASIFILALIIQRKITLKNFLITSFIPILLSLLYIFWLYNNNGLNLYYIYNYSGNLVNTRSYSVFKFNSYILNYKKITILFCLATSILTLIIGIKKQDKKATLLSIYTLFCFFITTHILYAANKHYLLPILPLFSVTIVFILNKIFPSTDNILKISFLLIFICFQINFDYKIKKEILYPFSFYMNLNKFITENTNKNDKVLIKINITGIKQQSEGYYYFGQQDIVSTVHNIIPYKELPNKKEIIITKKPKIIFDDLVLDRELLYFLQTNYTPKIVHNIIFLVRKSLN